MAERIEIDEGRLLLELQKGSEAALGKIIERYAPYVSAVIGNVASGAIGPEDREELAADSFYALWNNAGRVRPGKLKAYLGTIARNKAKDLLRSRGREPELEEDLLPDWPPDPEEELTRREEAELLNAAVDSLPEPDRSIFIRHYYLLQKTADIAQQLNININTVQTKLRRGRETLRLTLTEGGAFHG